MTAALLALALPQLPSLSREATLFAAAFALLLAIAVVGRALLAWRALARRVSALDELTVRLELALPTVDTRVAQTREQLNTVGAAAERALWALPELDRRAVLAERRLAQLRGTIDEWRGADDEGVRRTLNGFRGTLGMINAAGRLRRAIQR